MARMVLARIRRFGKQWASCGVPVSPPDYLKGDPKAKRLCPKLVPGQVIEVPDNHNLLNQACVEIVRGLEADEFERPWAFRNSEEALLANPSKSRLGADQIAAGLTLAEGAQIKGRKAAEERQEAARRAERDEAPAPRTPRRLPDPEEPIYGGERGEVYEGTRREIDGDDEDDYQPTSQNRLSRDEADELRGREDEPEEPEAPPVRRGRQPRGKR